MMDSRGITPWPDDDVILYDGVCVFCSRWVRFVARRDTGRRFRFTAIQSPYGTRLAQAFGIDPEDPDTNAVVHGGMAFFKSDAALMVLSNLPGWGWVRALRAIPKPLRDARVQSGGAESVPDFREVWRVFCAGCGDAGAGDGVTRAARSAVIASEAKQSIPSFATIAMDCFVAVLLAMTLSRQLFARTEHLPRRPFSRNPAPHAPSRKNAARSLRPQRTAVHRPAQPARRGRPRGRAARANRSRARRDRGPSAIPPAALVCGENHCRGSRRFRRCFAPPARRRRRLPAAVQSVRRKSLRCRAGRTGADDRCPFRCAWWRRAGCRPWAVLPAHRAPASPCRRGRAATRARHRLLRPMPGGIEWIRRRSDWSGR